MEQLDLFITIDKKNVAEPLEDTLIKRVEVEITKTCGKKAILVYREEETIDKIKEKLTEYFERVKDILGIENYKFLNIRIIE